MPLAYLHGGDLPLSFWLLALLLVTLFSAVAFAAFAAIMVTIRRRAERRTASASESSPGAKATSD